jgi:hypothetical protein
VSPDRRITPSLKSLETVVIGLVVLNVLIIVVAVLSFTVFSKPDEFQPFNLPQQNVLNRLPSHGSQPAMTVGSIVVVRGTKCNTTDSPVPYHGVAKDWASVDPPGSHYSQSAGAKVLPPGCHTKTYYNVMPPTVIRQVEVLLTSRSYVVWQLDGQLTAEHENGATRSWTTEPFYIYPKGTS